MMILHLIVAADVEVLCRGAVKRRIVDELADPVVSQPTVDKVDVFGAEQTFSLLFEIEKVRGRENASPALGWVMWGMI